MCALGLIDYNLEERQIKGYIESLKVFHGLEVVSINPHHERTKGHYKVFVVKIEKGEPLQALPDIAYDSIVEYSQQNQKLVEILKSCFKNKRLVFSFSTATSYYSELARFVCDALEKRGKLTPEARYGVELALHESIANALFHGNLELRSNFDDADSLLEHYKNAIARVEHPQFKDRRVTIEAWTEGRELVTVVSNEGAPFTAPEEVIYDKEDPHGRGLMLIGQYASSIEFLEGGRKVMMKFAV